MVSSSPLPTDALRCLRGGQYVDMIGYQYVCIDSQPLLFSGLLKAFIVVMGVCVVGKYRLSVIASLENMLRLSLTKYRGNRAM